MRKLNKKVLQKKQEMQKEKNELPTMQQQAPNNALMQYKNQVAKNTMSTMPMRPPTPSAPVQKVKKVIRKMGLNK